MEYSYGQPNHFLWHCFGFGVPCSAHAKNPKKIQAVLPDGKILCATPAWKPFQGAVANDCNKVATTLNPCQKEMVPAFATCALKSTFDADSNTPLLEVSSKATRGSSFDDEIWENSYGWTVLFQKKTDTRLVASIEFQSGCSQ